MPAKDFYSTVVKNKKRSRTSMPDEERKVCFSSVNYVLCTRTVLSISRVHSVSAYVPALYVALRARGAHVH